VANAVEEMVDGVAEGVVPSELGQKGPFHQCDDGFACVQRRGTMTESFSRSAEQSTHSLGVPRPAERQDRHMISESIAWKGGTTMKRFVMLAVALSFCLGTSLVLADQYLVVKDKSGTCKLQVFKRDRGIIIAGPFNSKKEADKAFQQKCPSAAKKPVQKKGGKK
jgi:hypothetical protein